MKTLMTFLLITAGFKCFCQDWALFPHGTDMYYFEEGTTTLFSCKQDSILVAGDTTIYYFNKIAPEGATQACYDSILDYDEYTMFSWPSIKMEFTGVDYNLFFYCDEFGALPAIFKSLAAVGSNWEIPNASDYSEFSTVTITCDSIILGSFLGITDSLKYYSIQTVAPLTGTYTIDKAQYILSKHNGLIRFLPFQKLLNPTTCEDCFKCYDLVGQHSDIGTIGWSGPLWENWIQLSEGDFLKYKHYSNSIFGTTESYTTALIQSVQHFSDSIVIESLNADGLLGTSTYYKAAIFNAINAPVWQPFYIPEYHNQPELDRLIGIADSYETIVDTTTFPGHWRYKQSLVTDAVQDNDFCYVEPSFEYGHEIRWDSYIGWTFESSGGPKYYNYSLLIGYVIDGQTYGNYWPLTAEELAMQKPLLSIFPNPATNTITVNLPLETFSQYEICDITGKICSSGTMQNMSQTIDIGDIPSGTYILKVASDHAIQTGKFVKL